jgi:phosphotriesterase-related protein
MTVLGPIPADALGVTLMHEHLLIDVSYKWRQPVEASLRALAEEPVTLRNLGHLRRNVGAIKDNLRLLDVDLAIDEARQFRSAGGGAIVDVTPIGIGRDPLALRAIAAQTGLHVLTCAGYYLQGSHPPSVAARAVDEIAEELIGEAREGIGDTGVRPGILKVGTCQPMYAPGHAGDEIHPDEEKVLRAAGRAHAATGLPIAVHIYNYRPNRVAHLVLDLLEREGVAPERVVICHLDTRIDLDYCVGVARRGALVELDTFGIEVYADATGSQFPRDTERIAALLALVERGCLSRLVVSHDVCTKMQLRAYGGWGYDHLSRHIEPRLRRAGLSEREIAAIRVDNPARFLDIPDR